MVASSSLQSLPSSWLVNFQFSNENLMVLECQVLQTPMLLLAMAHFSTEVSEEFNSLIYFWLPLLGIFSKPEYNIQQWNF